MMSNKPNQLISKALFIGYIEYKGIVVHVPSHKYNINVQRFIHATASLTLCMLGIFSSFCCRLLTLFQNYFSKIILSGILSERTTLSIQVLIVYKGFQQTIKVAASTERFKIIMFSHVICCKKRCAQYCSIDRSAYILLHVCYTMGCPPVRVDNP